MKPRQVIAARLFVQSPDFETRLRDFAREVARRHRGRPVDAARMVSALRGYHQALSIVADVPALDERVVAAAVDAYLCARGVRRPVAA
jgi:hypothetical protein